MRKTKTFNYKEVKLITSKNILVSFETKNNGSKVGYFRQHSTFRQKEILKVIVDYRGFPIIKNEKPIINYKAPRNIGVTTSNLKNLGGNSLDLNNFIGLDVHKTGLINRLNTILTRV